MNLGLKTPLARIQEKDLKIFLIKYQTLTSLMENLTGNKIYIHFYKTLIKYFHKNK